MKKKFSDSFNGLKLALNHKAVLVQLILGLLAIIGGLIIKLDHYEWLAFVVCIAMVIAGEIFNTAIEKMADYLNNEYDEKIKVIKDLSSAAVLVSSIGALVVCVICVLERILK